MDVMLAGMVLAGCQATSERGGWQGYQVESARTQPGQTHTRTGTPGEGVRGERRPRPEPASLKRRRRKARVTSVAGFRPRAGLSLEGGEVRWR